MASPLPVNSLLEVKFFTRSGTQTGINVLHYRVATIVGAGLTDAQVASQMSLTAAPQYKAVMSVGASYLGLRLQRLQPTPVPIAVVSLAGFGPGTVPGDSLPSQTSALITKRTNLAGRDARGRVYIGFASEGDNTAAGLPSPGLLVGLDTWASILLDDITIVAGPDGVTLTPVLYNRQLGLFRDVTAYTVRGAWATQRRRSNINRADQSFP